MALDPEHLHAHPGFVWVKSGYSESIAWRKARLTKQQNVELTSDGLWAMPLNTGWVPMKARRLHDWEKLKKYVPIHKWGDVRPDGAMSAPIRSQPLSRDAAMTTIQTRNNEWAKLCSACFVYAVPFAASCSKM